MALLIPTIDPELEQYAVHRDAFAAIGTTVAVSRPDVVRVGACKRSMHAWLSAHRFPTAAQTTVESALTEPQRWRFPLVVKPRNGSGSVGMRVVEDTVALEVAGRNQDVVVETLARGDEYSIDFLADRKGRCVCAVPRRRLEVRAGEVSKTATIRLERLQLLAANVCTALGGAYGPMTLQVFWDREQEAMSVSELNPRFGGGFPLSWEAGARFPQWMVEELLGRPSTAAFNGWRDGLMMLRYDDAVFVDGSAMLT